MERWMDGGMMGGFVGIFAISTYNIARKPINLDFLF